MTLKYLTKPLLVLLCSLAIVGCSDDDFQNEDINKFTDVIKYSILQQNEAVSLFTSEPLHTQLTPIFLDLVQQQKGI